MQTSGWLATVIFLAHTSVTARWGLSPSPPFDVSELCDRADLTLFHSVLTNSPLQYPSYFTTGPTLHCYFLRARPINILSHSVITSHLLISCDACFSFNFYRRFLFNPYSFVGFWMLWILLFIFPVAYLVSVLHFAFVNMYPNKSYYFFKNRPPRPPLQHAFTR